MGENIIELVNLTKKYGDFTAVDSLNLSIKKGEVFGLLGPNGAGKSTTILMLLGLTEPTSGSVKVCGIDPVTKPIEVKKRVGYLPEDVGFYSQMTGWENLMFTARLNSLTGSESARKVDSLLERVGLQNARNKKTGEYSRGMLQRLGLAEVLIKNPEVIILDEPTLGIDPAGMVELLQLIVRLSREGGITVLFSSHYLHQVQEVCDRVGIFVGGKLIAEGNLQELSQKLFTGSPYVIEVGLFYDNINYENKKPEEWLFETLKKIEGVIKVKPGRNGFDIECMRDATPEIARAIVESGAGLHYLNKKEYGLDEIYYRYFEGGKNHE
ncbi:MAG: ABC transporter ATP-binding protein [Bacteroidales bacterium]|nr:ABC transporter ATP-binding protein [Bacteroidales bacterium]HCI55215.1 ABC transporter ATP-binding protein [Bacteroidales bacterium]